MKSSNNLKSTLFKSSMLATILFLLIDISTHSYYHISPFMILYIIPISILCSLAILITIMPFIWLEKENKSKIEIFNKYFPYYSIIAFGFCSYFIVESSFERGTYTFFITAFFTLLQSWLWLCKNPNSTKEPKTTN